MSRFRCCIDPSIGGDFQTIRNNGGAPYIRRASRILFDPGFRRKSPYPVTQKIKGEWIELGGCDGRHVELVQVGQTRVHRRIIQVARYYEIADYILLWPGSMKASIPGRDNSIIGIMALY